MKPPLILDEKKLRAGIDNQSYEFAVNLKADLIAVLQFMKDNEDNLKIDLGNYETECGTYRCVAGWWAFWLGIPVNMDGVRVTNRFKDIFWNNKFFKCFKKQMYCFKGEKRSLFDLFFGQDWFGTLPERIARAKKLKFSTKLIK